ncbi:hypothetical protein HI914_04189 [Erysiphe necator]|nr:hypothetical protein HI914_04189 [Erysiphe necator]
MIFGNRNTHTPLRPLVGFALILLLLLRTTDTANNANTAVLVFVTLSPSQWMAPHPPCLRIYRSYVQDDRNVQSVCRDSSQSHQPKQVSSLSSLTRCKSSCRGCRATSLA